MSVLICLLRCEVGILFCGFDDCLLWLGFGFVLIDFGLCFIV